MRYGTTSPVNNRPTAFAGLGKMQTEVQQGCGFGVPPSGGGALATRMTSKNFNALDRATVHGAACCDDENC
jgi:hypothetical protein